MEPSELDALLFTDLVEQARAACRKADAEQASDLFRRARRLWRGVPYEDVIGGAVIADEVRRLEDLQMLAVQEHLALDLDLERHAELTAELTGLVETDPYRERLRALLMLALYRSGRQAEAPRVFREGRRLFAEELGVEPSAVLRRLHEAMLRGDERLARVSTQSLDGAWRPAASPPVAVSAPVGACPNASRRLAPPGGSIRSAALHRLTTTRPVLSRRTRESRRSLTIRH